MIESLGSPVPLPAHPGAHYQPTRRAAMQFQVTHPPPGGGLLAPGGSGGRQQQKRMR